MGTVVRLVLSELTGFLTLVDVSRPLKRTSVMCPSRLTGHLGNQIKHESDDCVDREQLNAFVPIGLTVAANQRAGQDSDHQRTYFGAIEREIQRLRCEEVT